MINDRYVFLLFIYRKKVGFSVLFWKIFFKGGGNFILLYLFINFLNIMYKISICYKYLDVLKGLLEKEKKYYNNLYFIFF